MNAIRYMTGRRAAVAAIAGLAVLSVALGGCGGSDRGAAADNSGQNVADNAPEGSFPGKAAAGAPVKVGLIVDEGGPAISQPESRIAVEAVVKYLNEQAAGLGGHPIELETCKNTGDAAKSASCANQMVEAGVVGVIIPSTGAGAVMAPIITNAGIAYTVPTAASPEEYKLKNAFVLTSALPGLMSARAKYAAKNGISKVTMFLIDAGTAVATTDAIARPSFEAAGVELTIQPIPMGTPDSTPQVAAGLKNEPDAVDVIGDGTMCTAVLKALDSLGSKVPRWMGQTCFDAAVIKAVGGQAFEGAKLFTTTDAFTEDGDARLFRAIMAKYAPGTGTAGNAQFGYQAGLSFFRAAGGVRGAVTAQSVLAAITSAKNVPLALGHGATMTCGGSVAPELPGICGTGTLVGTVKSGEIADVELIK